MTACPVCASPVTYVAEAHGDICTNCGLLSDAQQVQFFTDTDANLDSQDGRTRYSGPTTMTNVSGSRILLGQDSNEQHNRVNRVSNLFQYPRTHSLTKGHQASMHRSIQSLLSTLHHPGLTPRATNVFDLAMAAGKFRWGIKASLVSGAAIAVALRESEKSETLGDIAVRGNFILSLAFDLNDCHSH